MVEKRLALIIASYQYQDPDLQQLVAPAQDAEALARLLLAARNFVQLSREARHLLLTVFRSDHSEVMHCQASLQTWAGGKGGNSP